MGEVFFLSETSPSVAGSLRDRRAASPASGRGSFAYAERGGDPASCGVQNPSTPAQAARRSPSPQAGRRRSAGPCLSPPHEMGTQRDAKRRDGGVLRRITSPHPAPVTLRTIREGPRSAQRTPGIATATCIRRSHHPHPPCASGQARCSHRHCSSCPRHRSDVPSGMGRLSAPRSEK